MPISRWKDARPPAARFWNFDCRTRPVAGRKVLMEKGRYAPFYIFPFDFMMVSGAVSFGRGQGVFAGLNEKRKYIRSDYRFINDLAASSKLIPKTGIAEGLNLSFCICYSLLYHILLGMN